MMIGSLAIRLMVNTAALLIAALVVKSFDDSAIVILNWQSALLAGAGTYYFTRDWLRTVAVLIVACPCALILATPTAMVAAIGGPHLGTQFRAERALRLLDQPRDPGVGALRHRRRRPKVERPAGVHRQVDRNRHNHAAERRVRQQRLS